MKEISTQDPRLYTCNQLADLLEQLLVEPSGSTIECAEPPAKTEAPAPASTSHLTLRFEKSAERPPASSREAAS